MTPAQRSAFIRERAAALGIRLPPHGVSRRPKRVPRGNRIRPKYPYGPFAVPTPLKWIAEPDRQLTPVVKTKRRGAPNPHSRVAKRYRPGEVWWL